MTSVRSVELEKIEKYDAGMSHRRRRDQKQVRNVSSDVPVTFCGDWRHLEAPKRDFSKIRQISHMLYKFHTQVIYHFLYSFKELIFLNYLTDSG